MHLPLLGLLGHWGLAVLHRPRQPALLAAGMGPLLGRSLLPLLLLLLGSLWHQGLSLATTLEAWRSHLCRQSGSS